MSAPHLGRHVDRRAGHRPHRHRACELLGLAEVGQQHLLEGGGGAGYLGPLYTHLGMPVLSVLCTPMSCIRDLMSHGVEQEDDSMVCGYTHQDVRRLDIAVDHRDRHEERQYVV